MRAGAAVLLFLAALLSALLFLRHGPRRAVEIAKIPEEISAGVHAPGQKGQPASSTDSQEISLSSLPLELIGTIVRTSGSLATLQSPEARKPYMVNAPIEDLAVVLRIERDRVVVRNRATERVEAIHLGKFDPARAAISNLSDQNEFHLSRASVDAATRDLPRLLSEAAVEPVLSTTEQLQGFRLTMIKEGSVFGQLGLRVGDELRAVNGEALNSVEKIPALYNDLRESSMIELRLLREGSEKAVTYLIR